MKRSVARLRAAALGFVGAAALWLATLVEHVAATQPHPFPEEVQ